MDISINNDNFIPQVQQFPLGGIDVVMAIEAVKLAVEVVKDIGNAIMALAKELGIIPNMEIDELGARAIQAMEKGIRPEKFATTEEWVNKLMQDDWGYELKVSESISTNENVCMGIGTIASYLVDKFKQLPIKDFLLLSTTNPALFTIDRMSAMAGLVLNGSKVFVWK